MMSKLKKIDFKTKEFVGKCGKKYLIELDDISVGRYQIYERKALELAFGVDFKSIFATFSEIYQAATTGDSTLAALNKITSIAYGQMDKMKSSGDAPKDEFVFCTLFVNTPDEDRDQWDMSLAEQKIKDWEEYDARDFFLLSRSGIEGYMNALSHFDSLPKKPLPKKEKPEAPSN